MPWGRLCLLLLKNVVDKGRFGVLRHEHFLFNSTDLSFVESILCIITASIRILRFSNFIWIFVFIGVRSDLKSENCWSCQPKWRKRIVLSWGNWVSFNQAISIHHHLWACLFYSSVPWYFCGYCVVMTRGWKSFSFSSFHDLSVQSFSGRFLKFIFVSMTMSLNRYFSLLPVFLFSVLLWRDFRLGIFNDVV